MAAKKEEDKEKEKQLVNPKTKGAADDWEALKMVLESMPPLKSRVIAKLRELRDKEQRNKKVRVSSQEMEEMRRAAEKQKS
ncbi:MAG: hypothetical protein OXT67_04490 [Zetaproteobacteria bacterium]|nr:hypothetical protein [Zetaproteobacteria bacterium]